MYFEPNTKLLGHKFICLLCSFIVRIMPNTFQINQKLLIRTKAVGNWEKFGKRAALNYVKWFIKLQLLFIKMRNSKKNLER